MKKENKNSNKIAKESSKNTSKNSNIVAINKLLEFSKKFKNLIYDSLNNDCSDFANAAISMLQTPSSEVLKGFISVRLRKLLYKIRK